MALLWQTDKARYLLEYSFTKGFKPPEPAFRAEFIRLSVTPPTKTVSLLASAANMDRAKFSGMMHVKRDAATGDVWLADVPMVDQGQKGYCVVAATERVMRYYGSKVDENELAQAANTKTEGGTSFEEMLDALKKLGARLKVRVKEVEHSDVQQFLKLMAEYNREAKAPARRRVARSRPSDRCRRHLFLAWIRRSSTTPGRKTNPTSIASIGKCSARSMKACRCFGP